MQGDGDFGYREVGELRQMLNFMKRTVTGQGLENEGEETGDREQQREGDVRRTDNNDLLLSYTIIIILSTQFVVTMFLSLVQLRRGRLRMVVYVAVDDVISRLFWLATLTCCTVHQSPLLHGCSVPTDPSL